MSPPRTFTVAEKREAIAQAIQVGVSATSQALGISSGTLSCWVHKHRSGVAGYELADVHHRGFKLMPSRTRRAESRRGRVHS